MRPISENKSMDSLEVRKRGTRVQKVDKGIQGKGVVVFTEVRDSKQNGFKFCTGSVEGGEDH